MELRKSVDDFDQFVSTAIGVALAVVAIRSLQRGKRRTGALAGVGALAVGSGRLTDMWGTETTDRGELRCAICGEPIRPGERRKPDENGDTAHEACLEATV